MEKMWGGQNGSLNSGEVSKEGDCKSSIMCNEIEKR